MVSLGLICSIRRFKLTLRTFAIWSSGGPMTVQRSGHAPHQVVVGTRVRSSSSVGSDLRKSNR